MDVLRHEDEGIDVKFVGLCRLVVAFGQPTPPEVVGQQRQPPVTGESQLMKLTRQMIVLDTLAVGSVPIHDGYCFAGTRPMQALSGIPHRIPLSPLQTARYASNGTAVTAVAPIMATRIEVPPRRVFAVGGQCPLFTTSRTAILNELFVDFEGNAKQFSESFLLRIRLVCTHC